MTAKRRLTGYVQPRLWTPPLRPLNRNTSRGYSACDFAAFIGEPFLPWQRWAAIHALETLPDGSYRFGTVLVLVARQNGKSSMKRAISLWRLYIDGARLVLGVAQDVSLAREQWNYALDTIYGCPELAAELDGNPRRVNGDEWFRVKGGGRYKIAAANRKAGRGLSVDELTIDETREQRSWDAWSALSKTTMARPRAQIWCMSNAGDDESVVLNQLRAAALADPAGRIGLFEWSAEDGCDLDDTTAWRQANPGLGHTVSEAAIRLALATDPPNVFRTEVLCQKVDQLDGAIDYPAWAACADHTGTMDAHKNRLAACFDIAPDGRHATLAVAALLPDNRIRAEIVWSWNDADGARGELATWLTKIKPAALGWYPSGPGAEMGPVLRALALRINKHPGRREPTEIPEDGSITGAKVAEVCQGFAGLVRGRRIVHADQALLNAHVRYASKLPSGDGWRFTRKGAGGETAPGHVDAAYAAAGAVEIALTMPAPRRAQIRIVG
jgi:hypothetical protein